MPVKKLLFMLTFMLLSFALSMHLRAEEIFTRIDEGKVDQVKEMIGADRELLSVKNERGLTPLNYAAAKGFSEMATVLIELGSDLASGDNENSQAIHNAAVSGSVEILTNLLAKGADINARDDLGMTPLMFALSFRKPEAAAFLLDRGARTDLVEQRGLTALHFASIGGLTDMAAVLLKKGSRATVTSQTGYTPLHSAASFGHLDVAKLLLDGKAKLEAETENGDTPLMLASNPNCVAIARLLIERGAAVDHRNRGGFTAIHNAADRGSQQIIDVLLDNGADINAVGEGGWTPLARAAIFGNAEMVRFLILHGAEVNMATCPKENLRQGCCAMMTALHAAAKAFRGNQLETVTILVENNAKVNILDENGKTPLYTAVEEGKPEVVRYLLEHGAFINVRDRTFNRSELHVAAASGSDSMVSLLLDNGADLNGKDRFDNTAVDYAFAHDFPSLAYTILSKGADDSRVGDLVDRPDRLKESVPSGNAVVWHLGHAGWAVKTANHLLVFDYFLQPNAVMPENGSLSSGWINPTQLKDEKVMVFSSHGHADHYHKDIFAWKKTIPQTTYVMGFRPQDATGAYEFIAPREERTIDGVTIRTLQSTDAGVAFLVSVDGVTLFHAGDHANGSKEQSPLFKAEIDRIAAATDQIDLAFFSIIGCGLGDPDMVKEGVVYAANKLNPKAVLPMHANTMMNRYQEFAVDDRAKAIACPLVYATTKGDCFTYSNGSLTSNLTSTLTSTLTSNLTSTLTSTL